MTIAKYIGVGKEDRYKLRFEGRFFNIFNHPQYVGGNISDVASIGFTGTAVHNALIPTPDAVRPVVAGVLEQSALDSGLREVYFLRKTGTSITMSGGPSGSPLFLPLPRPPTGISPIRVTPFGSGYLSFDRSD